MAKKEKEFYFSDYAKSQNLSVETNRVVTFSIESEISTIFSAEPKGTDFRRRLHH